MSRSTAELLIVLGVGVLAFAIVGILYVVFDPIICNALTADIGFPHRWDFWSRCMIEPTPGQWIPLDNWRIFQ